jgi:hypothetical protein
VGCHLLTSYESRSSALLGGNSVKEASKKAAVAAAKKLKPSETSEMKAMQAQLDALQALKVKASKTLPKEKGKPKAAKAKPKAMMALSLAGSQLLRKLFPMSRLIKCNRGTQANVAWTTVGALMMGAPHQRPLANDLSSALAVQLGSQVQRNLGYVPMITRSASTQESSTLLQR